jgi:membrane protein YqaA with SNARE-associated domain
MTTQVLTITKGAIRDLNRLSLKQWLKLGVGIVGFIGISFSLSYASKLLFSKIDLSMFNALWLVYTVVFGTFLVSNLVLFAPMPFALTILIMMAQIWNPLFIGLFAATGASIGELGGYLAGYLGRKGLMKENFMCTINEAFCNRNINTWVERKGPWTIGILAAQPILPFDVAGIIAGSLKMPIRKFFIAMFIGKTLKYIVLAYSAGIVSILPFID